MTEQSSDFKLDPQLKADSLPVTSLALCDILLVNDSRYMWCLLVPKIAGLRDFHEIPAQCKTQLIEEIDLVSTAVKELSQSHKINVGSLGNVVEQLHIHIVGRNPEDAAWPGPVWGFGSSIPYSTNEAKLIIANLIALIDPPMTETT